MRIIPLLEAVPLISAGKLIRGLNKVSGESVFVLFPGGSKLAYTLVA